MKPGFLRPWGWSLLALALALLPLRAFAAPLPQADSEPPGQYQSELMQNELTGDTVLVTLALFENGDAEYATTFGKSGATAYQAGTWETADDGTILLVLYTRFDASGGKQEPNEPPVEIPFEFDGDTLVSPDFLKYGPKDLTLARTGEEPVSFRTDEGELRDDLKTGLEEFPDSLYVGSYRTQEFEIEKGEPSWMEMTLDADGSARFDYPEGLIDGSAYSTGRWRNNGDGTIDLLVVADYGADGEVVESYDPAEEFTTLTRLETGGLVAREIPLPDGTELIYSRTDGADEEPKIAGFYASATLAAAGPLIGMVVYLAEDGSMHAVFGPFDGETPTSTFRGTWGAVGTTVTLTATAEIFTEGTDRVGERPMRGEAAAVFTYEDGQLVSQDITLTPIPIATEGEGLGLPGDEGAAPPPRAESRTFMVDRDHLRASITVVLSLNGDGSASISAQLGPQATQTVELGSWEEDDEGAIVVTLDRDIEQNVYDEPHVLVFEQTDERTLTAIDYDPELYGEHLVLYSTVDY